MAVAAITAVTSIAGTAMSMAANTKAAKAEQAAMEARAAAKRRQADELLRRNEFNAQQMTEEAHTFGQMQIASFSRAGIDVGSGVSLSALADTQSRLYEQISIDTREAEYLAEQLRMGADIDVQTGKNIREAASSQNIAKFLTGLGGAVKGGYTAYKGFQGMEFSNPVADYTRADVQDELDSIWVE